MGLFDFFYRSEEPEAEFTPSFRSSFVKVICKTDENGEMKCKKYSQNSGEPQEVLELSETAFFEELGKDSPFGGFGSSFPSSRSGGEFPFGGFRSDFPFEKFRRRFFEDFEKDMNFSHSQPGSNSYDTNTRDPTNIYEI